MCGIYIALVLTLYTVIKYKVKVIEWILSFLGSWVVSFVFLTKEISLFMFNYRNMAVLQEKCEINL